MSESKRDRIDADETEALRVIGWTPAADGSRCPDSALLIAAEEGALDDDVARRVRTHVDGCATCQQLARDLGELLAETPAEAAAARIRSRISTAAPPAWARTPVWIGLGGLALAAGLAWMMLAPRQAPPPQAPDSRRARAEPLIPTVFVAERPAIPQGDVDLTVRGESDRRKSIEEQVRDAWDAFDAGKEPSAVEVLDRIARRYSRSRVAALGLGAAQLGLNKNTEAVATLDRARTLEGDAETADEVDWFLAIALVRTGKPDRARVLLDELCRQARPRSAKACAGVAEIDRGSR